MTHNVFLASKSPRRHALLTQVGFTVTVIASHNHTLKAFEGDEVQWPGESPEDYVERTAHHKFAEGLQQRQNQYSSWDTIPIVAADTVVSLDGEVLGKPRDSQEAQLFLERLSARTHEVRTAVVVGLNLERALCTTQTSLVTFKKLTEEEIQTYIQTQEPFDKAGGYGIQGYGGLFVSQLQGSFTGVMGLPIFETASLLQQFGCTPLMEPKTF